MDKLPRTWMLTGTIHKALPKAVDPASSARSDGRVFLELALFFGDAYAYSYDLGTLAAHFNNYRRIMAHWHTATLGAIPDVSYGDS